jgi:hypothetical protein
LEDLQEFDFDDEEGFRKIQEKLAQRDLQHEEEKEKKLKEKELEFIKQAEEEGII